VVRKHCETCGRPYWAHRWDQKHCDGACRVRAWRERQRVEAKLFAESLGLSTCQEKRSQTVSPDPTVPEVLTDDLSLSLDVIQP